MFTFPVGFFSPTTEQGDPYWSNVVLLLSGNGSDGSTTIVDSSPSAKTVTAFGGAQISTVRSRFGASSMYFPIASFPSSQRIEVANSIDFDFGSGDFTIEFWYYGLSQSNYSSIISRDGSDFPWTLYHGNSAPLSMAFGSASGWNSASLYFNSPPSNQWHYLAITRSSGTFRTFTNGQVVTTDSSWTGSIGAVSSPLVIGSNGGYSLSCNINDLRITKGIARYTANFTPPTAPFPIG